MIKMSQFARTNDKYENNKCYSHKKIVPSNNLGLARSSNNCRFTRLSDDMRYENIKGLINYLNNKCDPNALIENGSLLRSAIGKGRYDMMEILLMYNADPNTRLCFSDSQWYNGATALHAAIKDYNSFEAQYSAGSTKVKVNMNGIKEIIKKLLAYGARIDINNNQGISALTERVNWLEQENLKKVSKGQNKIVNDEILLLMNNKNQENHREVCDESLPSVDIAKLRFALNHESDIDNIISIFNITDIGLEVFEEWLIYNGYYDRRAEINADYFKSDKGFSEPLATAIDFFLPQYCKVDESFNGDKKNDDDTLNQVYLEALIKWALDHCDVKMLVLCLHQGYDPNTPNGAMLLGKAISKERPDIVEILLRHNADPNVQIGFHAHEKFNTFLNQVINLYGQKFSSNNIKPLILIEIIERLLAYGARTDIKNGANNLPKEERLKQIELESLRNNVPIDPETDIIIKMLTNPSILWHKHVYDKALPEIDIVTLRLNINDNKIEEIRELLINSNVECRVFEDWLLYNGYTDKASDIKFYCDID